MKANRLLLACALVALTTACVAERRPRPVPTQTARPVAVAPAPVPVPTPQDWRDNPLTPGDWSYAAASGGSAARFGPGGGQALLTLRCDRARGAVMLQRSGAAAAAVRLTVTTTDGARAFSATPQGEPEPALAVSLSARDPFLDTLAFSRGRFAVQADGQPTLYLPTWAEIGRVIEDCR